MGCFFASLISSVFSMFLFFHFPISMSRINDAVEICKKNYIKAYRLLYALLCYVFSFHLVINMVDWLDKHEFSPFLKTVQSPYKPIQFPTY